MWLVGRSLCISRARPASNIKEGIGSSIAPATGLDSETPSRFLKGTFKARTSKSKFFSQFSVFRLRTAKKPCALKRRFTQAEGLSCCALKRNCTVCPPSPNGTSPCGNLVEILWDVCVDSVFRSAVCLKGFEDSWIAVGQASVCRPNPSGLNACPLRRKAIWSLTIWLNVPVVRERIRAQVRSDLTRWATHLERSKTVARDCRGRQHILSSDGAGSLPSTRR